MSKKPYLIINHSIWVTFKEMYFSTLLFLSLIAIWIHPNIASNKVTDGSFDDHPSPTYNLTETASCPECYYGSGKYSCGSTPPQTCMICCGGMFKYCTLTKYGCVCGQYDCSRRIE